MSALQVLVCVTAVLLGVMEVGVEGRATYRIQTIHRPVHQPASARNAVASAHTTQAQAPRPSVRGAGKYSPVDYTPEVKKARADFFTLYDKQAKLAKDAPDTDIRTRSRSYVRPAVVPATPVAAAVVAAPAAPAVSYYSFGTEDEEDEYEEYEYDDEEEEDDDDEEEDDDDEEEEDDDDEDEDEEDSEEEDEDEDEEDSDEEDEDEEDSDEEDDDEEDSSSSEEGDSSSSEEGDDSSSSEEDEYGDSSSSSEEDEYGDDSSSSSSSSSSEEDGEDWKVGAKLIMKNLKAQAPKPVTDTPEVKNAKYNFYKLYKKQAELSFAAPDH